ncbi:MAG: hypothetical protein IPN44_07820 [Flavobacteriales bacterium]|nr:hypothetical protein [Flavobacteriales bacterium]
MRAQVPQYADQVLDLLNDPKNRKDLKGYLIRQFNEMADKTVGQVDYTEYNAILAKYQAPTKEVCLATIAERTADIQRAELVFIVLLVLGIGALAALIIAGKAYGAWELGVAVAAAFLLLVTGLSLPMIDIEATIASFSFTLVGEPVSFTDQVLFFQSKSILEVVWLLLRNGGFGLVLVSALVFVFSVLFPLAKLVASIVTIARNRMPTQRAASLPGVQERQVEHGGCNGGGHLHVLHRLQRRYQQPAYADHFLQQQRAGLHHQQLRAASGLLPLRQLLPARPAVEHAH